jgi:hypothetical protein
MSIGKSVRNIPLSLDMAISASSGGMIQHFRDESEPHVAPLLVLVVSALIPWMAVTDPLHG